MVLTSFSLISSSSSSFPSICNFIADYSLPSTSNPFRTRTTITLIPFPIRTTPFSFSSPQNAIFTASNSENGSPEQFLSNNSIADFMRFKRSGDGGSGDLQTAVVSYKKKFPCSLLNPFLQVDLVSTIHIADEEYFLTLQKELESYDCVLYEMVASRESLENRRNPAATKRFKGSRRGFNILGCIQRQIARTLRLDFQLDCLNYQAATWYHADLDFETFKLLQQEKGESLFSFARDMTLRSTKAILQPPIPEDLDPLRSKLLWASRVIPMPLVGLFIIGCVCEDMRSQASKYPEIKALSRLDFDAAMKVFLAKRLTSESTLVTAEVVEKSVIIGERNRVAAEALQKALDEGHNKIAILYGGGHMPDLGRRLREEFDLVPSSVQWITAWSIRKKNIDTSSFPFLKKMARASGWPLNRYETLALLIFSSVLALDLWFWELFFGTSVNWASELGSQLVHYVHNSQVI
ncbi:unnamed protein product [Lupinus luteus]|uniref:Uncharacterized protein n=1 Tax=Lupinus luteus TaxID=3873 RepID=A0AAV1XK80_LUPLU